MRVKKARIKEIDSELNKINEALLVAEGGVAALAKKKKLLREKKKLSAEVKTLIQNTAAQRRKRMRDKWARLST